MREWLRRVLGREKEPEPPLQVGEVHFRVIGAGFDLTFKRTIKEWRYKDRLVEFSRSPRELAIEWLERIATKDGLWAEDPPAVYYPPHAIDRVVIERIIMGTDDG